MKIAILTQPLQDNYGGLLQAYALKEVLQQMENEVVIVNRIKSKTPKLKLFLSSVKAKALGKPIKPKVFLSDDQKNIISKHTIKFRQKYIPNLSELITDDSGMQKLGAKGFDAYVVGSDQCWRPRYSPNINNYFLDFTGNNSNLKRISYAASFGTSNWEFNAKDTVKCKNLAQKFDAISVREDSAVNLVNQYLDKKAIHVVDPTMLLSIEDYKSIIKDENIGKSEGEMMVYILDINQEKQKMVDVIEKELGFKQFQVLPKKRLNVDAIDNIESFVYPNPAQWLRGFQDAKFTVTDSFHGTVFSILFNVPFISIANKNRGVARFESLLKMFGLEDRLVLDVQDFDFEDFREKKIDWDKVNSKLEQEKSKAFEFLKSNLS